MADKLIFNLLVYRILKLLGQNKKNNLFYLFCLCCISLFSQNKEAVDSLKNVLKKDLSINERSQVYRLLSYHHYEIDSSLLFAKKALLLARESNNAELQADAWGEISHVHHRLGNKTTSLSASLKALHIYDSLGLDEIKAASYVQLASNSISNEDYQSAISYLKNAESIYAVSDEYNNLTLTQLNLGEAYRLADKLDSASLYFKKTLKRNKTEKNLIVEGYSIGNLGMVLATQGDFRLSKQYLTEAIKILETLEDEYSTSVYIAELGKVYWKESQWDLAEAKLLTAYNMASNAKLKEQIRDFSGILTDFYKEKQEFEKALNYLDINRVYEDSLVNKSSIQKIEQLKAGYEINKRETEITLLNTINANQRNQMLFLGIGIFVFILLAYMLYRSNKAIKKVSKRVSAQNKIIEKREQEKALLLKELNHRVKNNLQMISSLLNLQSRELSGHPAQEALLTGKNRVEALSLVHQKLYQEGTETKVFLKDYIEELVLGLFYGYSVSFKPEIDIDNSSISIDKAIPLALIVNEMVVNSLKYAYKDIELPKFKIALKEENDQLELDISDNGVGFTNKEGGKANSFGLKLIKSLIEQLDGNIKKLQSQGTQWKITIPNN